MTGPTPPTTTVTLNSGCEMPMMGLGVWRMKDKSMKEVILHAIRIGYRHFDCADFL
ncbi:NADP-dependent D-sorbitol-6-phosphate dehydrogenase [Acorus calamus]|uniref:NADP-dependent D-sorbitol-6-phosphate dehydrogenase n=1 Tax=Acorus calamus TaxID=4465 RepID=A0AAV9F6Z5_ACOCL|nr:NADP-dependent D-sorbitol-6-phosphate dehydrogenase [Acorus calamus]